MLAAKRVLLSRSASPYLDLCKCTPRERTMKHYLLPFLVCCCWNTAGVLRADDPKGPADLIVYHAHLATLDNQSRTAEAIAINDGRIIALGADEPVLRLKGPKTVAIDGQSHTVLPGLWDSHVHPTDAATSELKAPLPSLKSLKDVFAYIRDKAATTPEGEWIVVRYAFPTRLDEARFPTRAELDEAAPRHPVLYHAGPAGMVNTMGLKVSGITKDTPNPSSAAIVVKDPVTGEPTGMLGNACGVLKGLPSDGQITPKDRA